MHRLFQSLLMGIIIFTNFFPAPGIDFQYKPLVAEMLSESQQNRWLGWIKPLSGESKIQTEWGDSRILTRSSMVMFEANQTPSAFTYIQDQLKVLGFKQGEDFQVHTYAFPYDARHSDRNWKNLILTIPGKDPALKKDRVLLIAHLDSTSNQEQNFAPGADDNASGVAGLLEAAAILRYYKFERTIHLIWFSGEEQSRLGSQYFVKDFADWLPEIIGVVNMDMFAFDGDGDRCFEIHAGTMPKSQEIGQLVSEVIRAYQLNLTFDFIDDDRAYKLSDHAPFWEHNIPGIMIFENFFYQADKTCGNSDRNFNYHRTSDTFTYLNPETGFSILQAAIGTIAHMAQLQERCFSEPPQISSIPIFENFYLTWQVLDGAETYQVWSNDGNQRELIGETQENYWLLPGPLDSKNFTYEIVARSTSGCQSEASRPVSIKRLKSFSIPIPTASWYREPY
ncbi:MAG: M28 family metallopeptidase [Anaerolineales bacterium]